MLRDCDFGDVGGYTILKIKILQHISSSRNMMWIKNCNFRYNKLGTVISESRSSSVHILISFFNVALHFTNCHFFSNKHTASLISIKVINNDHVCSFKLLTSYIQIKHSNFIGNMSPLINIYGGKVSSECITQFSMIGPFMVKENDVQGENMIMIHNTDVNIIGNATFSHNFHANNVIYLCNIKFFKNISFIKNGFSDAIGAISQIITLHSDLPYIKVMENTNIRFINNTYLYQPIQVIIIEYTPYPFCVFQYETSKTLSIALLKNYSISFYGGIRFFSSTIEDAYEYDSSETLFLNYYTFHCQWLPKSAFYGYHPADINKQIIHTDDKQMYKHTRVCYCFMNNTYDCSLDLLGPVFPGQVLQVNLCVPHDFHDDELFLYVDTHNAFLPNSACKIADQNQLISTISNSSKRYNFTIVSESRNECELFLTAQPELYKRYDAFYVQLLPCPIAFTLQDGVCNCDPVLSTIIDNCDINYSAITRPANSWVFAHAQTNNTEYLIANCPMDYCLPYSSKLNLLYPDVQCQFNRTGMICSQCQHSLSMVFGSSRCMKCTNMHIFISIIVIVAGIVLVVLLYVLNLTVTNGTINGILFYANLVSINDSVFLVNDNVFKPLRVFIAFANLDLGIETCFYNGMDSYAKMWLQLVFPSYLIIIAISIIIASRYSNKILRLTYTRSLPVLATLFLLSYTGVLRTVLTVLFSYSTITHLPSGRQELVWSIDASVPLFGIKFTILFIACLVLFLILISFNIILLFTRYCLQFRIVNRFKPLLDAFQGSYKDKFYYWIAICLALRSFMCAFYAFPTTLKLIFSTILLMIFGFYSGYVCPHKNKVVNIQELLLLLNLAIMYAVSYQSSINIFIIVMNIMINLAFAQFGIIVLYHLLTYTCHCNVTHKINTIKQKLVVKLCSKNLCSNLNDIPLLNIPECTYNYSEYRDGLVSDDFK